MFILIYISIRRDDLVYYQCILSTYRQMAVLSALIIAIIADQLIFVTPFSDPERDTINNDPINHLKNLMVKLPATEGGTNQNGNVQVKRLQGLQNLKLADVVGPRSCPFYHIPTVEPQYLKQVRKFKSFLLISYVRV